MKRVRGFLFCLSIVISPFIYASPKGHLFIIGGGQSLEPLNSIKDNNE